MSIYIQSTDGTTIDRKAQTLPAEAWVDTSIPNEPAQGTFVPLTEANKNSHGWYTFDNEIPAPSPDHVRTTERVADQFEYVWTFSQQLQDDNAAEVVRQAKADAVDNAVAALRQWAIDAAGTTVTTGNNTAVTQILVDRLGVFFDRFADLVESKL